MQRLLRWCVGGGGRGLMLPMSSGMLQVQGQGEAALVVWAGLELSCRMCACPCTGWSEVLAACMEAMSSVHQRSIAIADAAACH
jgi:hypothetical protein